MVDTTDHLFLLDSLSSDNEQGVCPHSNCPGHRTLNLLRYLSSTHYPRPFSVCTKLTLPRQEACMPKLSRSQCTNCYSCQDTNYTTESMEGYLTLVMHISIVEVSSSGMKLIQRTGSKVKSACIKMPRGSPVKEVEEMRRYDARPTPK